MSVEFEKSWELHPGQLQIKASDARFKVVACGRRWGKTFFAADYLGEATMQTERGGRDLMGFDSYYIAPTFSQAKDVMFRLIERMWEPCIKKSWPSSLTFEFVSGRMLQLKGADRPDRLRGVGLADAVLDEYASMRPEVWPYVVMPTMADLSPVSRALFIGSPSGRNHFYALYKQAEEGKAGWAAWTFRTIDSPLIPAEEIEQARETMAPHAFRQEFEADFGDSADCPLDPDSIAVKEEQKHRFSDEIVVGIRLQSFEREQQDRFDPTRVDMTTFCVMRINGDKAHVLEMERGRFTVREMCTRILALDRKYRPFVIAMESRQHKSVETHLNEREMRFGRPLYIETVSEAESSAVTSATWNIQPPLESGRLTFEPGDYIEQLRGQFGQFPDEGADSDMIKALSYACSHIQSFSGGDAEEWSPLDEAIGI